MQLIAKKIKAINLYIGRQEQPFEKLHLIHKRVCNATKHSFELSNSQASIKHDNETHKEENSDRPFRMNNVYAIRYTNLYRTT